MSMRHAAPLLAMLAAVACAPAPRPVTASPTACDGLGGSPQLFPVSSETLEGFDEVVSRAQDLLLGSEDLETGTRK